MKKPSWVKVLSGHAGSLLVAGELEKRGILVNVLPERFEDFDLLISKNGGNLSGTVQVKACNPDRADSIDLGRKSDNWGTASEHNYVVVVWMGSMLQKDPPVYWIAAKRDFGALVDKERWVNRERRFGLVDWSRHRPLRAEWKGNWEIFEPFQPPRADLVTEGHVKNLRKNGPPSPRP